MKADSGDPVFSNDVETPFLQSSSQSSAPQHARKKPLTLLPLIALIFFEVSGGPFGTEVRHSQQPQARHAGKPASSVVLLATA